SLGRARSADCAPVAGCGLAVTLHLRAFASVARPTRVMSSEARIGPSVTAHIRAAPGLCQLLWQHERNSRNSFSWGGSMLGVSRAGDVVTIELQREQRRNALNIELVTQLRDAVLDAAEQARVIVLTGRGP